LVDVRPGQTTEVNLGGGGRKARARLVLPEDTPPLDLLKSHVTISGILEGPPAEPPVSLPVDLLLMDPVQQRAWWQGWLLTPEGQRFKEAYESERTEVANCMTTLEAGGELRMVDILPGQYELKIHFENPDPSVWGSRDSVASLEHMFDVPDAEAEAYYAVEVDLGEIPIHVTLPTRVSRPAPPFVVDTADGRTIQLSDLKGRFVLLDILEEPWSQQTLARYQILRQIHAAHASTGRLEIISVIPTVLWPVSNRIAGPLRTFVNKRQLPWTAGIIPESHRQAFYWGYYQPDTLLRPGHYPSSVLIGPETTVLALDIPQDELREVVDKTLQGP
jgi:hypothetical protein